MTRKREPTLKNKKGFPASKRLPPKAMTFDDESDDAFDPSPIPSKRRKLNNRVATDISDDDGTSAPRGKKVARAKSRETDEDAEEKLKPGKKAAKVKNHVHVPQSNALLEDQFCTQEPELNSSPHRIRGPIWRKTVQISSNQIVRPVQPKTKLQPLTSKVASTSESSEVSDDDDDSFEAVQLQQSLLKQIRRTSEPDVVQTEADRTAEADSVSENEEAFTALNELDNRSIPQRIEPRVNSVSASTTGIDVPDFPDISDDEDALNALTIPNLHTTPIPLDNTSKTLSPLHNDNSANLANRVETAELRNVIVADVNFDFDKELADLPSDAFSSSSSASPLKSPNTRPLQDTIILSSQTSPAPRPNLAAPTTGLRQITLFGDPTQQLGAASQANKRHNWPLVNRNEPPTHHKLDREAMKTYVYPTNLGTTRDYQYNIVARGLYNNLLVALPTGLGKTFIAATIMLNWFRWTTDAQIVFVAPTKPLVSQQVEACFGIAGIPRSQTSMLTGGISPGLRAEEWKNKRVFFMTPQTIVNDLKTGIADPKRIVLLVVDEAHRATGGYAYVEVVKFIRRFNQSFRILALTATPGSSVESVQEVIDGLDIARVEIRTESSIDIRQFVHSRPTDIMVLDNTPEMEMVMGMFAAAVQPVLSKLNQFNAYWTKDPMALTAYGLTLARQKYMGSNAGRNASAAIKGMVNRIFSVLASLAHSIELLKFHGITPFYNKMKQFRSEQETSKSGKYEKEILDSDNFQKMMTRLQFWCTNPEFVGHPKLEFLVTRVVNHFLDAGEGREPVEGVQSRPTRIMIFAHYRDSAEEIVRVLQQRSPTVRPHVFVGQAAAKGSEGMDQKRQLQIINEFKDGKYNTLVATSIGEEGLDIGEVDLIICYDSSASPIRMLQRMGRTGRKRAGKILLLLMRGKEEQSFTQAKDNYEKMQVMIAEGKRFKFHDEKSPRIVPLDIQPEVDKRVVEIPKENNEATLPEPSKKGRAPKRPPKKFHMPDGVRTGFVRASRMEGNDDESDEATEKPKRGRPRKVVDNTEPQPSIEEVTLTAEETKKFERRYLNVTAAAAETPICLPRKDAYPSLQRVLRPFKITQHSKASEVFAATLKRMHDFDDNRTKRLELLSRYYDVDDLCDEVQVVSTPDDERATTSTKGGRQASRTSKAPPAAKKGGAQTPAQPRGRPRKTAAQKEPGKANKPVTKGGQDRPGKSSAYRDNGAMEALSSSPPLTDPRLRLPSQGIALGSDDTSGDGEEDNDAMDSELADFINDEDDAEEERTSPASLLSLSLSLPRPTKPSAPQRSLQNIFSSEVASESENEDEEEDLNTLLRRHQPGANGNINRRVTDGASKRTTSPQKRKRNVIEDSSD